MGEIEKQTIRQKRLRERERESGRKRETEREKGVKKKREKQRVLTMRDR
jgi:hypothetical protein